MSAAENSNRNRGEELPPFRENSVRLTKECSAQLKKSQGIYLTPRPVREQLWGLLPRRYKPKRILEPSFGSGEFLQDAVERFPGVRALDGIELNQVFYDAVEEWVSGLPEGGIRERIHLKRGDFLAEPTPGRVSEKYDLIVGNPPFVVVREKNPAAMTGRGNLFVLFLYECLTRFLAPNGLLAFVLPTSFMNCGYYEPCRRYIYEHCVVEGVEEVEGGKWIDTSQKTMVLLVRNRRFTGGAEVPRPYFFERNGYFLTPYAERLRELVASSRTLEQMGYEVKTGQIVWNQHKEELRGEEDGEDTVLLLYDTNLTGVDITLHNLRGEEKKQYIRRQEGKTPVQGPCMVIARGFGNQYRLRFAVIPGDMEFYGENHLNVITLGDGVEIPRGGSEEEEFFLGLMSSLEEERTNEFVKLFVGNGALSKTDIFTRLPFYVPP